MKRKPKGILERIESQKSEEVVHVQVAVPASLHAEVTAQIEKLKASGTKISWQRMLLSSTQTFSEEARKRGA